MNNALRIELMETIMAAEKKARKKVYWSKEERDLVVRSGILMARTSPTRTEKSLFVEAMKAALPEPRWIVTDALPRWKYAFFRDAVAAAMTAGDVASGPKEESPLAESWRRLEKPAEDAAVRHAPPREPGTDLKSLVTGLLGRHFDEAEANVRRAEQTRRDVEGIRSTVEGLGLEVARLHGLLVKICEALDPAILGTSATPPDPDRPPTPIPTARVSVHRDLPTATAGPTRPKIKACVVGVLPDQGRRVEGLVRDVADIRTYDKTRQAVVNGFKTYDLVVMTRHADHAVQESASRAIGHDRVVRMASTSVDGIADVIRTRAAAI